MKKLNPIFVIANHQVLKNFKRNFLFLKLIDIFSLGFFNPFANQKTEFVAPPIFP